MEAADRSGISERQGVRARPGRLRAVRCGYGRTAKRHAETGFRGAAAVPEAMEAAGGQSEIALGRRSYCACSGRWRAVRPGQHEDTVSGVSQACKGALAG